VCFLQPIDGQLIFLTAGFLQSAADLIIQMEWISKNSKRNLILFHQSEESPEIRMQDRISSGNIKIGQTFIHLAEVEAIVKGVLHLLPCHGIRFFTDISRENIAMFAPLITLIGDVPLKRKILFHKSYSSLPQAFPVLRFV
jgi:acyl-CoA synthetase (AMP-forming)/AMP-acid ligase II